MNREEMKETLARGGYDEKDVQIAIARMEVVRMLTDSVQDFDTFADFFIVKGV